MKDISMPVLIVSAVIVALASSITALTVNPTGNVMGFYSLQDAGTQLFYDDFTDMSAWTGNIGSTTWHTVLSGYNSNFSAFKDAYGTHYISHAQSTAGYSDITVSFAALNRLQDTGEFLGMFWYDGTTWTSKGNLPRTGWTYYSYTLPVSAANNPNFAIKFVCYDWHTYDATDYCQIDAVKITGTPIAQNQTCSDGTPWNQCSVTKPNYCANGTLVNNCVMCGCPTNQSCNATSNACYIPPGGGGGGGGMASNRYEERIVLGERGQLFSQYDESASTAYRGHGLYLSAPYSTGAIDFRLQFIDPLAVGSNRSFSRMPQINMLGRILDIDYKNALNGSLPVYTGAMNPPVVLYQGNGVITEDGYQLSLDAVTMGSNNTYYAIYKATNQSGATEISAQLTNGWSYSFFGNKLRVQVITVGFDSAAASGYANTNVTSKLKVANMYAGDSLTATNGYNIRLDSVTLGSSGKYYAVYTATNPSGATETSVQLTNGIEYFFFGNAFGVRAESVAYDTKLSKGMAKTNAITGRYILQDSAAFPLDNGWTVKHVDVSGSASQGLLNYIALKYGSATNPPQWAGTVQTGLAQGVWINGPRQADNAAKFQMRLKGFGSTSTVIGTTTLTVYSVGSSGSNITTTHLLRPLWTARDGTSQWIDATLPGQVVIPDPGKDGSFNTATGARWMVVNDKVVYLKSIESTGIGTQYQVRFAIGRSGGQEVVVGPFANASGASAWMALNSSVNPILCKVVLGSPAGMDMTNVTLLRSGEITLNDSFVPVCDLEPNTVPIGSSTLIPNTNAKPFMDLRFIQGRSSGEYGVNIEIDGVVKHWPLLITGKYKNASTSQTESAAAVYDSELGSNNVTGLIVFKDLEGFRSSDGLVVNTTNKYRWVNQAVVPPSNWGLDYVKYDITPLSVEIMGAIRNTVFLTFPSSTRPTLIEFNGGANISSFVELTPLVGTMDHYKTSERTATITPDTFTVLKRYVTYVTVSS